MNRLHTKCYFASAGLHVLLLGVLVIGPAFVTSRVEERPITEGEIIQIMPSRTTDGPTTGGNRNALPPPPSATPVTQPPAPHPAPPMPQPEPVKVDPPKAEPQKPEPELPKAKPPEPDVKPDTKRPPSDEPDVTTTKPVRKTPQVSLTPTTREKVVGTGKTKPTPKNSDGQAEARASEARERQARSALYSGLASNLKGGLSGRTSFDEPGPGNGGPLMANFADTVRSIYNAAWNPPASLDDELANVVATVTIGRDGYVAEARISKASGNAAVDASVRRTLDQVKYIAPFPEGARESQRTYKINFNLKAKRMLG